MSSQIIPPTKQEIEFAFGVVQRSLSAHKASGKIDPDQAAFQQLREQRQAVATECEKTSQALYQRLLEVLPEEHYELLAQYSLVAIAPHAMTLQNVDFFKEIHRKAKQFLSSLNFIPQKAGVHD